MKVAINSLPLKSAHKTRGIGYYTGHLMEALRQDPLVKIQEFTDLSQIRDIDVIHYPWFDLFFHTLSIKRRFPTIVTVHDVIPLIFHQYYPVGVRGRIAFMMQKMALKSCRYIITDSKVSKEDIMKTLKVEEKKIKVIPLAADEKFKVLKDATKLFYIKRKYHLPDRYLLYVGDANWVKNLPFLIEGFKQVLNSPNQGNIKLVLAGGMFLKDVENIYHPELQSLKIFNRLIKQYKLDTHIVRPGQIE